MTIKECSANETACNKFESQKVILKIMVLEDNIMYRIFFGNFYI